MTFRISILPEKYPNSLVAEGLKANGLPCILLFSLISQQILKFFLQFPFLKWKLMFKFKYVHILCAFFAFCALLMPSFEINCDKIHTMSLVLNIFQQRFFVFYLLWRHRSPATEEKFKLVKADLLEATENRWTVR